MATLEVRSVFLVFLQQWCDYSRNSNPAAGEHGTEMTAQFPFLRTKKSYANIYEANCHFYFPLIC